MRRTGFFLIFLLIMLAGCRPDPKSKANDWARRFPEEIGTWEADNDRLELTPENASSFGHVTLTYEGDDDIFAYLSVDVYATETAANVALGEKVRGWQLQGARFETDRRGGERVDIATFPGGTLAYMQSRDTVITLTIIPPDPAEVAIPQDEIEILIDTMVEVVRNAS
ncbi:MAG: hypothetical protein F9K27_03975 [Anaerolineae bacterium]|nr:MAG: hypothetical protein F9K27_03975 [Anaerolineae bacterium]